MKNKVILIFTFVICILTAVPSVIADGQNPIQNQQSYPVPQLYPIGQVPNQIYSPNNQQYTPQPQQYNQQPYYYYPDQQPYQPYQPYQPQQTQPQYYYGPEYYNTQPIYDPMSGQIFYPINNYPNQYPYQPGNPYGNDRNVIVGKQWNPDGSVDLTWTIRNNTREDWGRSNVDIKCISGCHLLTNPNRTLWDIPHTVHPNGMLTFTVNIWQPMYNETMTFSMVAGSKTLYTFNVNPN